MSLENMITPASEHQIRHISRDHNDEHVQEFGASPTLTDSTSTDQHVQKFGASPTLTDSTFLTGYIDCAQEALWYLTQVEKLPLDHPTVMGLQMHLWEQYKILHLQQLLDNSLHMCNDSESVITDENTNIQKNNVDLLVDRKGNKELSSAIDVESSEGLGNSAINSVVFNAKDNEIPQTELRDVKNENVDQTDIELSPEAQQVAEALAEEIYSLLNAENDLDEYECDSADEGFEEMTES